MALIEMGNIDYKNLNNSTNIYFQNPNSLGISEISSSIVDHHYLCKECLSVPIIHFQKDKLLFFCKCCKDYPKELTIDNIINYLSENNEGIVDKLKCQIHSEIYNSYCEKCKLNLCNKCLSDCIKHKERIINISLDIKTRIKINYIIKRLELKLLENTEKNNYYNNSYKYFNKSENLRLEQLQNSEKNKYYINCKVNDNNKYEKLIFDEDNIYFSLFNQSEIEPLFYLFSVILNDYENYPNFNLFETVSNLEDFVIYSFDEYNIMKIKYTINKKMIKDNKIETFSEIFVSNNKSNCFIISNENIKELSQYINVSEIIDKENLSISNQITFEIKLIEKNNRMITNLSFMFYGNSSFLISCDFSNFNMENITKINGMFYNCLYLSSLYISKWDTKNVIDMSYLFYNCSSLEYLPDISNWNTSHIIDMSYMFYNCSKLASLPNISEWKTNNVTNMKYLFYNCSSLLYLPDISSWDTEKVTDISYMFSDCLSLRKTPNISIWNIKNVRNASYLFNNTKHKILFDKNKNTDIPSYKPSKNKENYIPFKIKLKNFLSDMTMMIIPKFKNIIDLLIIISIIILIYDIIFYFFIYIFSPIIMLKNTFSIKNIKLVYNKFGKNNYTEFNNITSNYTNYTNRTSEKKIHFIINFEHVNKNLLIILNMILCIINITNIFIYFMHLIFKYFQIIKIFIIYLFLKFISITINIICYIIFSKITNYTNQYFDSFEKKMKMKINKKKRFYLVQFADKEYIYLYILFSNFLFLLIMHFLFKQNLKRINLIILKINRTCFWIMKKLNM